MKAIISLLLICFFCGSAYAQQVGERITETAVVIFNSAKQPMTILLGEKGLKPDTFKLEAEETWHSPAYRKNPVVRLKTKNKFLTYQLKIGSKYIIFWNDKKKVWDVKKV